MANDLSVKGFYSVVVSLVSLSYPPLTCLVQYQNTNMVMAKMFNLRLQNMASVNNE